MKKQYRALSIQELESKSYSGNLIIENVVEYFIDHCRLDGLDDLHRYQVHLGLRTGAIECWVGGLELYEFHMADQNKSMLMELAYATYFDLEYMIQMNAPIYISES